MTFYLAITTRLSSKKWQTAVFTCLLYTSSSHILDVVEKVCNKVSVIKHGQLLYSSRTTEIVGTKGLEEVFMEMNGDEISVTPTKE